MRITLGSEQIAKFLLSGIETDCNDDEVLSFLEDVNIKDAKFKILTLKGGGDKMEEIELKSALTLQIEYEVTTK